MNQKIIFGAFFLIFLQSVSALEIKGMRIPDQKVLAPDTTVLLNGAGVRSKFVFSIYVGSLYVTRKVDSLAALLSEDSPRSVTMQILYDEISAEKLVAAWQEGFAENHEDADLAVLNDRIGTFNGFFDDVKAGDVIELDYQPAAGTVVTIRGERRGAVPGKDFNDALMRIWLGENPADSALKEAMLNGDE